MLAIVYKQDTCFLTMAPMLKHHRTAKGTGASHVSLFMWRCHHAAASMCNRLREHLHTQHPHNLGTAYLLIHPQHTHVPMSPHTPLPKGRYHSRETSQCLADAGFHKALLACIHGPASHPSASRCYTAVTPPLNIIWRHRLDPSITSQRVRRAASTDHTATRTQPQLHWLRLAA